MHIADILIYIAGIVWTIETIPQIVKLVKTKQTAGISSMFFVLCSIAYVFFLIGNIMLKQWSVVFSHAIPFINILIIITLVTKYKNDTHKNN